MMKKSANHLVYVANLRKVLRKVETFVKETKCIIKVSEQAIYMCVYCVYTNHIQ